MALCYHRSPANSINVLRDSSCLPLFELKSKRLKIGLQWYASRSNWVCAAIIVTPPIYKNMGRNGEMIESVQSLRSSMFTPHSVQGSLVPAGSKMAQSHLNIPVALKGTVKYMNGALPILIYPYVRAQGLISLAGCSLATLLCCEDRWRDTGRKKYSNQYTL
jgi:hypothetical protein